MTAPPRIIEAVVLQHAQDAADLWGIRDRALRSPRYRAADLGKLDDRIAGHLDGLRLAGDAGRRLAIEALETGGPGELFVVAWLELDRSRAQAIPPLVLGAKPEKVWRLVRGVVAALAWCEPRVAAGAIAAFWPNESDVLRYTALAAAGNTRTATTEMVEAGARSASAMVRARAFRAAGQMRLTAFRDPLVASLRDGSDACRFWAAWSAVLLGEPRALAVLQQLACNAGPYGESAAALVGRATPPAVAYSWWTRELAGNRARRRAALRCARAMSLPESMPWLLERMNVPNDARLAGEAFASLTGLTLSEAGLEGTAPAGFDEGPNDDPDDDRVAIDADHDLAWPNPAAAAQWWSVNAGRYPRGVRHFRGRPASEEAFEDGLRGGTQPDRADAAIELALLRPGAPLGEPRTPCVRPPP